jgi:hypothetical protein
MKNGVRNSGLSPSTSGDPVKDREGGREKKGMKGEREGGKKEGREGGREGGGKEGRKGRKEGGREGGRKPNSLRNRIMWEAHSRKC